MRGNLRSAIRQARAAVQRFSRTVWARDLEKLRGWRALGIRVARVVTWSVRGFFTNKISLQSAGAVLSLPLGGDTFNVGRSYIREGRPATPEESANAAYLVATPDYFHALQIPLVAGRAFTDQDTEQTPKVLIVNESMARQLWPGESPVGKRITIWRDEKFPREIVGVVGDTKRSLDAEAGSQMYVPFAQDSDWGMSLVIRTNADPAASTAAASWTAWESVARITSVTGSSPPNVRPQALIMPGSSISSSANATTATSRASPIGRRRPSSIR